MKKTNCRAYPVFFASFILLAGLLLSAKMLEPCLAGEEPAGLGPAAVLAKVSDQPPDQAPAGGSQPEPKWKPPAEPASVPQPKVEPKTPAAAKTDPETEPTPEPKKTPLPDEDDLKKAVQRIRDDHRDVYAVKKLSKMRELAVELVKQAEKFKDNPIKRFAFLQEAGDLAAQAGDAETALDAIEKLDEGYDIDAWDLKTTALQKAVETARTPDKNQRIADSALELAEKAVTEDHFKTALQLASVAEHAAAKIPDKALQDRLQAFKKETEELGKEFKAVQAALGLLKKNPKDANANLTVGKYFCLRKGDWERGLPYLAQGGDGKLKHAAEKDRENPTKAEAMVAAGDQWWDLFAKENNEAIKLKLAARAKYWYDQALPDLDQAQKAGVEKRLKNLNTLVAPEEITDGDTPFDRKMKEGYEAIFKYDFEQAVKTFEAAGSLATDNVKEKSAAAHKNYSQKMSDGWTALGQREYKGANKSFASAVKSAPDGKTKRLADDLKDHAHYVEKGWDDLKLNRPRYAYIDFQKALWMFWSQDAQEGLNAADLQIRQKLQKDANKEMAALQKELEALRKTVQKSQQQWQKPRPSSRKR